MTPISMETIYSETEKSMEKLQDQQKQLSTILSSLNVELGYFIDQLNGIKDKIMEEEKKQDKLDDDVLAAEKRLAQLLDKRISAANSKFLSKKDSQAILKGILPQKLLQTERLKQMHHYMESRVNKLQSQQNQLNSDLNNLKVNSYNNIILNNNNYNLNRAKKKK
jgi:septal ring factor EnvC (AmiA/AmiB activator)